MSVLVAAIGGITVTVLGAFWLAHKIVEATLEDEARADARTPEMAKAARVAIEKKRAIVLAERKLWFDAWSKMAESGKESERRQASWRSVQDLDGVLKDLADEEAKIPLYDEEKP